MKNFFPTTILFLIGIFAFTSTASAQLYEVSLDEKIQQSSLIVEGRVSERESYRASDGRIYTANKIDVATLLKGDNRDLCLPSLHGEAQSGTKNKHGRICLRSRQVHTGFSFLSLLVCQSLEQTGALLRPTTCIPAYRGSSNFHKNKETGLGWHPNRSMFTKI